MAGAGLGVLVCVAFVTPALVIPAVAHYIRRRRDFESVANSEPAGEDWDEHEHSQKSEGAEARTSSRACTALAAAAMIVGLMAALLLPGRSAEDHCKGRGLNLRHLQKFAAGASRSTLVASKATRCQLLFDVALIHAYGFSHVDAAELFRQAWLEDTSCALCVWGQAYVAGPFINKACSRSKHGMHGLRPSALHNRQC
jgi:hypothetical protein